MRLKKVSKPQYLIKQTQMNHIGIEHKLETNKQKTMQSDDHRHFSKNNAQI